MTDYYAEPFEIFAEDENGDPTTVLCATVVQSADQGRQRANPWYWVRFANGALLMARFTTNRSAIGRMEIAGKWIATFARANSAVTTPIEESEPGLNTRSPWLDITLANGMVMAGCFPFGEAFSNTELDLNRP